MKFRCNCDEVISDQTDFLPYKAYIVSDQDQEQFLMKIIQQLHKYNEAKKYKSSFKKWILDFFTKDYDPKESPEKFFETAVWQIWAKYGDRTMYQCNNCGCIFIEDIHNQSNILHSYNRTSDEVSKNILEGLHREDSC